MPAVNHTPTVNWAVFRGQINHLPDIFRILRGLLIYVCRFSYRLSWGANYFFPC